MSQKRLGMFKKKKLMDIFKGTILNFFPVKYPAL